MNAGLNIPQNGTLDLVALGALNHRVDPGIVPFRKAREWHVYPSGGQYNLADCFRLRTGIVSAMVDYPIGNLIADQVQAMGIKPFYKHFAHNGVTGPNVATVYSDQGHSVRAPMRRRPSPSRGTMAERRSWQGVIERIVQSKDDQSR